MKTSFSTKIYLSNSIIVLLVFISSIYSILMINKTQEYANDTGSYWIPIIENCQNVINLLFQLNIDYTFLQDPEKSEKIDKQASIIQEDIKKISELKDKFDILFSREEQKVLYADFDGQWKQIRDENTKFFALLKEKNKLGAESLLKEKIIPDILESKKLFSDISDLSFSSGRESTQKGKHLGKVTTIVMSTILFFAIIACVITIKVIRAATKKLVNSVVVLKTQSVLCGGTGDSLRENSDSFSASINEQALFVKETMLLVNEIIIMIKDSAENTAKSIGVINASAHEVEEGKKIMDHFVSSMNAIQESSSQLHDIANIISQINLKTTVINDIVSKTELLSLNASIESARAAEHGKGFAVVAEEVGNLAKISGKSANEIQLLIQSSQERVKEIISSTQNKIEEGKKITYVAQENFMKIAKNIVSIHSAMEQIIDSSKRQDSGVRKIFTEIEAITKDAEKNQNILESNKKLSMDLVEQSKKIDNLAHEIEHLITAQGKKVLV